MQHIDKIFKLHNTLRDRRTPITGKALQEKLECSRATRDRIIKYMREMLDAPIVYDKNRNGFYYDHDHAQHPYELPGLWFNAQELQALLACQHLLANVSAGILQDDIVQLQNRLEKLLRLNNGVAKPDFDKIKILNQANRRSDDNIFLKVAAALFNGKRLRIGYHARGDNQHSQRDISPQTLVRYRDNWYMDAWCHLRGQLRSFAIDRIVSVLELDQSSDLIDTEQLQQHFASSYGIFSGSAKHLAVLKFSASRSRWVSDENWHPEQQSQWLDDGRYQLSIPFNDHRELLMDILKHGSEVEVVAPGFLVEAVREQVAAMGKIYGDR
ncbi:helix-turn-helix transcriptional regulator [Candidatus Methylobacter oryzae]|uniref:WYL domain-containing protein n=1 Tax=Candidatus Methylobacter oryzae TaxID=2497749 RepID=A0ABY3CDN3_9GAMM|nr:WYL domain-containing protein [Candidatus Methylobacter oryzae]TRX00745.1 WYL domain-containing protein [Candidatus Methylobacter oryzae]